MLSTRVIVLVVMILFAAATRLIPPLAAPYLFLWNFTALAPMCLFGGAYFRSKWAAFLVPMVALAISDVVLAATFHGFRGLPVISVSYVLFALITLLGMTLRGRVTFVRVAGTAIGASLMFFLASNFHVWLSGHDSYPYTIAGLLACYAAAIPFAINMLLGNLFYSGVLFGGYALLSQQWPSLREPVGYQPATVKVRA
jgi:hypothetical protein